MVCVVRNEERMSKITVKELKAILEQANDEDIVVVESLSFTHDRVRQSLCAKTQIVSSYTHKGRTIMQPWSSDGILHDQSVFMISV